MERPLWWLARSVESTPDDDEWLTPSERAYVDAQRFTKRSSEFRAARYTAKSAVARVLELATTPATLARIEIRHETSGAPYACLDGRALDRTVSLTDRADWAVCLVGDSAVRIGCDLELVEPRTEAFVADYFTPDEQRCVAACADEDGRNLAANLIWSAKESALKVLTTGLRRDTRSVAVSFDDAPSGWGRLTVLAAEGVRFDGWWRRYGSFVLTTASAEPVEPPAALDLHPHLGAAVPSHGWLDRPVR